MFVVIVRELFHPVAASCDAATGWRTGVWRRAAERGASVADNQAAARLAAEWEEIAGNSAGETRRSGFCVHLEFRVSCEPAFWAERKMLARREVRVLYGQEGTSSS